MVLCQGVVEAFGKVVGFAQFVLQGFFEGVFGCGTGLYVVFAELPFFA